MSLQALAGRIERRMVFFVASLMWLVRSAALCVVVISEMRRVDSRFIVSSSCAERRRWMDA